MKRLETIILHQLINNDEFRRKVIPFLKNDYFSEIPERVILEEIDSYNTKYNSVPTKEILSICVGKRDDLTESENKEVQDYIKSLKSDAVNIDWLIDETEKFVKDKAVYNAIFESIEILEGKKKTLNKDSIPLLLSDALGISFDTNIGHDWIDNAEQRWEYYHEDGGKRIPFQLSMLNKITRGGMKAKTLNSIMAPTGVGKTIFMCDVAAHALVNGHNVLYITMEMAAEDISERIDSNALDIPINEVRTVAKEKFLDKVSRIKEKTNGKLIVKEYPTNVNAGHFRALIEELKMKKSFVPDLLIVDYLGICGSQRVKVGVANSNTFLKAVSEELRDLGKEYNIPVLTGHQVNRGGHDNTDVDMENVAESIGVTNTLDLFFVVMAPPELVDMNQYLVKQLKNRYNDVNYYKKFVVGIDKSRMRFFDIENTGEYMDGAGKKDEEVDKNTGEITFNRNSRTAGFDSFNFN